MIQQGERSSTFTRPQGSLALTAQRGSKYLQPAVFFPFFTSGQHCLSLLLNLLSPPATIFFWLIKYS